MNISGNIFSVVPEILFIIVEFPATIIGTWILFSWFASAGFFSFLLTVVMGPVMFIGGTLAYMVIDSYCDGVDPKLNLEHEDWIIIKTDDLKQWNGYKLPMREAYEWYFRGKIEFTKPLLEVFLHRYQLFRFVYTQGHLHEIVWGVLGKAIFKHDASGDAAEIQPVYNLGNDFYYSFLADPMFYSCGVAYSSSESLEVAQKRKCGICAELLDIKDGDRILDFGCGWGSWLIYCAENFDVQCLGMTISQCQLDYALNRVKTKGLEAKVKLVLQDYREFTKESVGEFDKITCFEMSEHVGIRNYQTYMAQVKALLKDDGIFFL
jgi:2-polyprenyl-3-methyl-5-hydroxy-6-metoxy-1,4-benzoquinol methylase